MKATTLRPAIIVLAFVMMTVRVGSVGASGDIEPVLVSIDCFLERQMDRFWPPPVDYPPQFQDAQLIQTYDVEESDPEFVPLYHRADTYDAALAAIYFMRRGNLLYARRLLDAMLFVQAYDPQYDPENGCPTRTSYWANDLLAPNRQDPSIDHWQIATGNLAYQIIALTRFYRVTGEEKYLDAARCMAEWIEVHTNQCDMDGFGGFSLGSEEDGSPIEESTKARTIEHNVDVYAFATNLCRIDGRHKWREMARCAQDFVKLMFDEEEGKYWLGTKRNETADQIEINYWPVATDAQAWTALATVDMQSRADRALDWLTRIAPSAAYPSPVVLYRDVVCEDGTCQEPCSQPCDLCYCDDGGTSDCCYHGMRFTNGGEHIQGEATAGAAMALWLNERQADPGEPPVDAEFLHCNLDRIRLTAPNHDPDPQCAGMVATPWCAGAPTGFEDTCFPNKRHVASTVWYGLALLVAQGDAQANPLWVNRRYVDDDAPEGGDGMSWDTAYKYVQDALWDATTDPTIAEIWVGQGTYTPDLDEGGYVTSGDRTATFQLISGVAITGGYAGYGTPEPDVRDIELYESILSGDIGGDDGPDFENNGDNSYHVVTGSGTDGTAVLDGFTITAGNANGEHPDYDGGGMYNFGGSPTLVSCTFVANAAADSGGGMCNSYGSPSLTDCTFIGNVAEARGGGMFNEEEGNPTLTGCAFIDNSAYRGGGLDNRTGSPTLTDCTFVGNVAEQSGGGMFNGGGSGPDLLACRFTANSANSGGGMNNWQSNPTLTHCQFTGNAALLYDGGGMFNGERSNAQVSACAFVANTAQESGGGICNVDGSNAQLIECRFSSNSAGERGGAIQNWESSPRLLNCMFGGNGARWSGAVNNDSNSHAELIDCVFAGNSVSESGGAMSNTNNSDVALINSVFVGNVATYNGGAVENWNDSDLVLTNCTLSGNSAELGGGISSTDSCSTLGSSILWGNVDVRGWGAFFHVGSGAPMVNYSCIQDHDPDDPYVYPGTDNIDDDPLFIEGLSGTWTTDAFYGSETGQTTFVDTTAGWVTDELVGKFVNPNTTQFLQGIIMGNTDTTVTVLGDFASLGEEGAPYEINDYHLSAFSPCVNQGSNYAPDLPEEDIEGGERVQECRVDMGPYESPYAPDIPDDCNGNSVDDDCEIYNAEAKDYNENHVPDECDEDCNGNGIPDFADLLFGSSDDCNFNAIPDGCEADDDCNANGKQDICDIAGAGGATPFASALGLPQDIVESEGEYPPGFFVTSVSPSVVYHVSPLGGNVTIFATDLSHPVGARMVPDEFGGRGNRLFVVNQLPPRLVVVDESGNVDGDSFAGVDDVFDGLGVEVGIGIEYVPLGSGEPAEGNLVITGIDGDDAQGGYVFLVDETGKTTSIVEPPAPWLWTPRLGPASFGEFGNHIFVGEANGPGVYALGLQTCELTRFALVPFDENMRGVRQIAFSPVGWASSIDPTLEHERVLLVSTTSSLYLGEQVVKSALMMWAPERRLVAVMRKGPDGLDIAPRGLHFVVDDLLIADNIECHGALRRASVGDFGLLDCNSNAVLDECDFSVFTDCMAGPEMIPDPQVPGCVGACLSASDFDGDGDVDLRDFAIVQRSFTGP